MDKNLVFKQYKQKQVLYDRAGSNIKEALTHYLAAEKISFLSISYRVKAFDSFFQKIERKNYTDPFNENEDFCGLRIILYYLEDIERVAKIITSNFQVQEQQDKSSKFEENEFGYRSNHFIIKIKPEWSVTPNYDGLSDVKVELQLRTVLMHAWAEIEHKLGYKNEQQIPKNLRRKLFLMSAKLEDADSQFQEIKEQADEYIKATIKESQKSGVFKAKEWNLETLKAMLAYYFPDYDANDGQISSLLAEINTNKLSVEDTSEIARSMVKYTSFINEEINGKNSSVKTSSTNILAYGLVAALPDFKTSTPSEGRRSLTERLRKKQLTDAEK